MQRSGMQQHGMVAIPKQTNREFANDKFRRNAPWTKSELEDVRQAAMALVRTHTPRDTTTGTTLACFDGKALWALLGALDRTAHDKEDVA